MRTQQEAVHRNHRRAGALHLAGALAVTAALGLPAAALAAKGGTPGANPGAGSHAATPPGQAKPKPHPHPVTPARPQPKSNPGRGHAYGRTGNPGRRTRAHGSPAQRSESSHPDQSSESAKRSEGRDVESQDVHGQGSTRPKTAHQKVTICHATGSATNPYVEITISVNAVKAHMRHQDGRDIIPAPASGCPGAAGTGVASGVGSVEGGVPPTTTPSAGPAGEVATEVATLGHVLPQATAPAGRGGVKDEAVVNAPAPASADAPRAAGQVKAVEARADRGDSGSSPRGLPFTGFAAGLVLLLGLALLSVGLIAQRAARQR